MSGAVVGRRRHRRRVDRSTVMPSIGPSRFVTKHIVVVILANLPSDEATVPFDDS